MGVKHGLICQGKNIYYKREDNIKMNFMEICCEDGTGSVVFVVFKCHVLHS